MTIGAPPTEAKPMRKPDERNAAAVQADGESIARPDAEAAEQHDARQQDARR